MPAESFPRGLAERAESPDRASAAPTRTPQSPY